MAGVEKGSMADRLRKPAASINATVQVANSCNRQTKIEGSPALQIIAAA